MPFDPVAMWQSANRSDYTYGNGYHDTGRGLWAYASYND